MQRAGLAAAADGRTATSGSTPTRADIDRRGARGAGDGGDRRGPDDVLVRVHSQCLTGDVFGSLRCDCGEQLDAALEMIAEGGQGRHPLPAAGGARHRPAQQAAGLRAAGAGARHGRGERAARLPARPARLRHRRPDPPRPRRAQDPPDDEQPDQVRRPRRLRPGDRRARPAGDRRRPTSSRAYLRAKREKLGHLLKLV